MAWVILWDEPPCSATSIANRCTCFGAAPVRIVYASVSAYTRFACWQTGFGCVSDASCCAHAPAAPSGAPAPTMPRRLTRIRAPLAWLSFLAAVLEDSAADRPACTAFTAADTAVHVVPPIS